MFKPNKGPKDGRSPPGLLYSGSTHNSRTRYSNRQLALGLVVTFCFLMGYFILNSENGIISSIPTTVPASISKPGSGGLGDAILKDTTHAPAADSNVHEVHAETNDAVTKSKSSSKTDDTATDHEFKPIKEPLEQVYQPPANSPSVDQIEKSKQTSEDDDEVLAKPYNPIGWRPQDNEKSSQFKSDKSSVTPTREQWADRPQFEKSLQTVLSMLPDEVHMRELIRPVEGSGKEKMREMGLRTRAYKKYFEAWEALHMTTDAEGATYIRDDVISYLRSHQQTLEKAEFNEEGVDGMNLAMTIRQYEAYRVFLLKFAQLLFPWTSPYFADHMSLHASIKKGGRGIVLTAGDDQAPYLLTTIYSFRRLGCTLPIEVMYLGDQDLGEDYRAELEALPGVITRDIAQMTNDKGWALKGWAAKPFAILLSSFREVIFIDADSLFFRNPEDLFEDPDYKKTGALFFKDRLIMPENKKRWLQQILPKPVPKLAKESRMWTGESGHQQESGVVVVDKWKHFIAMLLITRFNGPDRDGNKEKGITGVYDMMYGDKETFWIGFLLAGDESYAFHKGDAGIMGELGDHRDEDKKDRKSKRDEPENADDEQRKDIKGEDDKSGPSDAASGRNAEITKAEEILIDDSEPTNFTICAPQLLHLDTNGKPLWFNGWLLHNKFAEKSKKRFANFEVSLA